MRKSPNEWKTIIQICSKKNKSAPNENNNNNNAERSVDSNSDSDDGLEDEEEEDNISDKAEENDEPQLTEKSAKEMRIFRARYFPKNFDLLCSYSR
jgi:hypothetical protein